MNLSITIDQSEFHSGFAVYTLHLHSAVDGERRIRITERIRETLGVSKLIPNLAIAERDHSLFEKLPASHSESFRPRRIYTRHFPIECAIKFLRRPLIKIGWVKAAPILTPATSEGKIHIKYCFHPVEVGKFMVPAST